MTCISGKSLQSRGFTLIELLVVISVIGVLSSIVLASVASARGKAKDAAIKELALQMRNVYEMEYSSKGTYAGLKQVSGDGSVFSGNFLCNPSSIYSCTINNSIGCTEFYFANTEGEKICKDLFNKGVPLYNYLISTKDLFVNTYAAYIQYPSGAVGGRCISGNGYNGDVPNYVTCFDSSHGL